MEIPKIPRNSVNFPQERFIDLNNTLSTMYKAETDLRKKQQIIESLYKLDLPIFKGWNVFSSENREDFEQEAFIWIERALSTFNPLKGSFLAWLKTYYVKKSWNAEIIRHKKATTKDPEPEKLVNEKAIDHFFWKNIKKDCDKEQWFIIQSLFFEGRTVKDIATDLKRSDGYVKIKRKELLDWLKVRMIQKELSKTKEKVELDYKVISGEQWFPSKDIAKLFHISTDQIRKLADPSIPSDKYAYQFDPRDVARFFKLRIRYLSNENGLIYPRVIKRKGPKQAKKDMVDTRDV